MRLATIQSIKSDFLREVLRKGTQLFWVLESSHIKPAGRYEGRNSRAGNFLRPISFEILVEKGKTISFNSEACKNKD